MLTFSRTTDEGSHTAAHICFTTLGLGGLIATNAFLAAMTGSDRETFRRAIGYSFALQRIFGPTLGIGILLGFAVMGVAGIPAASGWLLIAYVLVAAGIVLQAAVAVPWQLRAMRADDAGVPVDRGRPRLIAAAFALDFVAIVFVMVLKP